MASRGEVIQVIPRLPVRLLQERVKDLHLLNHLVAQRPLSHCRTPIKGELKAKLLYIFLSQHQHSEQGLRQCKRLYSKVLFQAPLWGTSGECLDESALARHERFSSMLFSPASLVVINFALFSGIGIGSILNEGNDVLWTVVLSILGALVNVFVWRHISKKGLPNAETMENESSAERERLMEELSEEAERRRELDRIELN
jgi:hypothetical protein